MRDYLFSVGRAVIGFGVAALLIRLVLKSSGADVGKEWNEANHSLFLVSFVLFGLGIILSSWRWRALLKVQQVDLPAWDAFKLTMIGTFFNLAIPGGVGGDVVKMVYLRRHAGERTPEAVMTTLFDRILGLLGLFVVALGAIALRWDFMMGASHTIQGTVFGVCAVSVVGGLAVLVALFSDTVFSIPFFGTRFRQITRGRPRRFWRLVARVVRAIALFRAHLGTVALTLGCSVTIHVLTAISVVCIGRGLHAEHLQISDYFLAVQIANTVSAVPITPGGLGGRDLVLATFFEAAGEGPKRAVIGPFLSMLIVIWGLIGGIFFLLEKQSGTVNEDSASVLQVPPTAQLCEGEVG
jgi:uncharacterized protein (TIRG00374 family)